MKSVCVSNCCITVPSREQALIKSLCVSLPVGQMLRRAPQGAAGPGSHVTAGGLGHWLETAACWASWAEKSATQRERAGTSGNQTVLTLVFCLRPSAWGLSLSPPPSTIYESCWSWLSPHPLHRSVPRISFGVVPRAPWNMCLYKSKKPFLTHNAH